MGTCRRRLGGSKQSHCRHYTPLTPLRLSWLGASAALNVHLPSSAPAGGGRAQRGRDLHGTALVPRLVAFLVAPAEPGAWSNMTQKASAALVEYLTNSRGNCELLAAMDSRWVFEECCSLPASLPA